MSTTSTSTSPRPSVIQLAIKEKAALYAAYIPLFSEGGIFIPTVREYKLGDDIYVLLSLPDDPQRYPVAGKVGWLTPANASGGRTQGVGVLSSQLAINAGVTGPMLRATGVNYDLRKVDAYGVYSRFDFRVPLGDHGDVYDRYMIRVLEMRESLKILQQAFAGIPAGPIMDPKAKLRGFRPKAGEAYGRIEGPKGEIGFYLISDGSPNPYRYRVRAPSFVNLTILEDMCLGQTIADAVIILGSVDIVLGEVDR